LRIVGDWFAKKRLEGDESGFERQDLSEIGDDPCDVKVEKEGKNRSWPVTKRLSRCLREKLVSADFWA